MKVEAPPLEASHLNPTESSGNTVKGKMNEKIKGKLISASIATVLLLSMVLNIAVYA